MATQDSLSDERFQELLQLHLHVCPRPEGSYCYRELDNYKDHFAKHGIAAAEVESFLSRLLDQQGDPTKFGLPSLHDTINGVDEHSSDTDLERFNTRLVSSVDSHLTGIRIRCPDGSNQEYDIEWMYSDSAEHADKPASKAEIVELQRKWSMQSGGVANSMEAAETVRTTNKVGIQTPTGPAIVAIPIATILYEGEETAFQVIRPLSEEGLWVMFDRGWIDPDIHDDRVPPDERRCEFPGTSVTLSLGILSDLFSGEAKLKVYSSEGFVLRSVMRFNGVMRVCV